MSDIVFMDTETLGLHPDAPVWDFAAIRRHTGGEFEVFNFTIDHNPEPWIHDIPTEFRRDYDSRFEMPLAYSGSAAAAMIHDATSGAHVIGAVPNFDTERLAKLLLRNNLQPAWHYHLVDVENLIVGYLAARGQLWTPPWKSDELSLAVGVDSQQFERHTAIGDVLWVQAQYDAVMGGAL